MVSLQAAKDGYNLYNFVVKPSEDFFCPVTFDLLREPYLTPCCGNHLSHEAVSRLQGQPCPMCKEPNLNPVHDKFSKRQLNKHKVRCPNKSLGCEWVGELGELDRHLSQNSVEGECQFVTVACPYSCGNNLQRCQLKGHRVKCPNRPFTCQYCNYKATYITVTIEHWPICTKYPVECPNKSLGCQWAGERGDLDQHLSESSVEGECQFVTVACPYSCGDDLQRCQLEGHKMNDCPNRPFTCEYCGHEATYIVVTDEHLPVCEKYPLACPNECGGGMIERQDLEEHLEEVCPLQVVRCEFSYAGCEFECQRQHMQDHVNENAKAHLSMVSTTMKEKVEELEASIERQDARNEEQDSTITELQTAVEQQQKQIVALMSALTRVSLDVQKPIVPVFITPPDIVLTDFEEHKTANDHWFSPPFYSHIGGYKMCLRVDANGWGDGEGTHVSWFVYLMKGEHDDQLKWPFRGDITIQLLNQRRDGGHRERTLPFDDRTDDDYGGRVVGQERASGGWGYHKFIAHNELSTKDKEYLKNDCLKFQVIKFAIKSI